MVLDHYPIQHVAPSGLLCKRQGPNCVSHASVSMVRWPSARETASPDRFRSRKFSCSSASFLITENVWKFVSSYFWAFMLRGAATRLKPGTKRRNTLRNPRKGRVSLGWLGSLTPRCRTSVFWQIPISWGKYCTRYSLLSRQVTITCSI